MRDLCLATMLLVIFGIELGSFGEDLSHASHLKANI
jgi:hypothetical protein